MGAKIKVLNMDRGGEYQGAEFVKYLKSKGTQQKLNMHDTLQQAGVAEHHNRMIGKWIWALLHASGLPKFLWGEAAHHVVWLLNRTTTKAVEGMMPFEAAFGKKPDLKGVREWGEKTYVRVEGGTKLGGQVKEGHWLGVNDESKGVRIYWPDTKLVTVKRNVYYDNSSACHLEEEMEIGLVKTTADSPEKAPVEVQNPDTTPITKSKDDNPETEPENKRIRKPSQKVANLLAGKGSWSANNSQTALTPGMQQPTDWTAGAVECEDKYALLAEIGLAEALEPRNLGEAKKRPDWPLWEVVIDEELKTLKEAET